MIAAKQPTFRFLFSGSRSITSAKTERTFGGLFLLGCLSQVMMMMLCEVEALQSKLSLQKPITTQLSDLQKTATTRERRASFLFLTIIIMFTYIPHSKIMYFLLYFLQKATRVFSHSRQLTKLVAKVCTQNDWKHFKPCSADRHFYLAVLREFALLKKLYF